MAKDNEKKVAGEMNEDELENVAGGWCFLHGISKVEGVEGMEKIKNKDGTFDIVMTLSDGRKVTAHFNEQGKMIYSL